MMHEGLITDEDLWERYRDRPVFPDDWQATVLRSLGLNPEKYELVRVFDLCAYRIVRRP